MRLHAMTIRGKALAACFVALSLFSCAPAGEQAAPFDEDAVAREVKAARKALDAAMAAEDIDGYLAHFLEDAVWMPPNSEEFIGHSLARRKLESLFQFADVEGTTQIEEQVVMGPDWVADRGEYHILLYPKDGEGEPVGDVGSYLALWKKDADGKWKIAADIWNSDRGTTLAAELTGQK